MTVLETVAAVREWRSQLRSVGLVPTMGALHAGHAALIRAASDECESAIVSIFVNPTQFGPGEDFERYPRRIEQDLEIASGHGASAAFIPARVEMYQEPCVSVRVTEVSDMYEGKFRPGHFDGVATVVLKLFNIVQPTTAYFGLKDLQQCAVIGRMVEDLNLPVHIREIETVREMSGLAMSSRNDYFSTEDRQAASLLYEVLAEAAMNISALTEPVINQVNDIARRLDGHGFQVEYVDYVDRRAMRPLPAYSPGGRVVAAVKFAGVRLIDNVETR